MKILLTGSDGYIGSVMGPDLMARGHDVVGLDTGFYHDGLLARGADGWRPAVRAMDIRRVTARDLEGFDAVIHLAELSNDPLGELAPEVTERVNHGGSAALARAAKAAGVARFLYSSSCSVYGKGDDAPRTEESPTAPLTAYARCKLAVELELARLADSTFAPVMLRNATVFGASPRLRFDLVVNNLAGLAFTRREIRMVSDGTPWRPLIHVKDLVEAFAQALTAPREAVAGQVFNVGADRQNYRVREIAELIAQRFPGCAVSFNPDSKDDRSYRVSFAKLARALPDFACRRDVAEGVAELGHLFERIGLTEEHFLSRHFTRLTQLKHLLATGQLDRDLFWRE